MQKTRICLLLAAFTALGFGLGLAFDNLFTKSYAEERDKEAILPAGNAFETTATAPPAAPTTKSSPSTGANTSSLATAVILR